MLRSNRRGSLFSSVRKCSRDAPAAPAAPFPSSIAHASELAEKLLLLVRERCRRNDRHLHMLIAVAVAAQLGNALALEAEVRARLRAGRNLQLDLLGQCRNLDVIAQRSLRERQRNLAVNIIVLAVEEVMRLDAKDDVQVAVRAALGAAFPFAVQTNLSALINTRRNADVDFTLLLHFARAVAGAAFFLDDLAGAAAVRAGAAIDHAAKRRVLNDLLLSRAAADGAGLRLRAGLRSGAVAGIAVLRARNRNFRFLAEHRFLELDRHRVLKIVAPLRGVGISAAASAAEEHVEDVAEAAKILGSASAAELVGIHMTVLIIYVPLLVVTQRVIRFLNFLELRFGVGSLVDVRMVLPRQLS